MLRVELHDASNSLWLRVEGRFVGAFAEQTRALVLRCELPWKLVVDLSEMTFADAGGEQVLSWLGRIGALFVGNGCYALHVCERLRLPMLGRIEGGSRGRTARIHYTGPSSRQKVG